MSERSDELYSAWRQASEKFDYFVLAVTGALCAYITQTFQPKPFAISPNTLEFVALLLLIGSVFAGFRRIEVFVAVHKGNHQLMQMLEESENLVATNTGAPARSSQTGEIISALQVRGKIEQLNVSRAALRDVVDEIAERATFWYRARNRLIATGVFALLAARIWAAYV